MQRFAPIAPVDTVPSLNCPPDAYCVPPPARGELFLIFKLFQAKG